MDEGDTKRKFNWIEKLMKVGQRKIVFPLAYLCIWEQRHDWGEHKSQWAYQERVLGPLHHESSNDEHLIWPCSFSVVASDSWLCTFQVGCGDDCLRLHLADLQIRFPLGFGANWKPWTWHWKLRAGLPRRCLHSEAKGAKSTIRDRNAKCWATFWRLSLFSCQEITSYWFVTPHTTMRNWIRSWSSCYYWQPGTNSNYYFGFPFPEVVTDKECIQLDTIQNTSRSSWRILTLL